MASKGLPGKPGQFGSGDETLRRLEALEANQRELAPSIAKSFASTVSALQEAQANLEAQQAELSDAIDDINDIISKQIEFGGIYDQDEDFSLPAGGSAATVVSDSVAVPAGYTQAVIMATGYVWAQNQSGAGDFLYGQLFIDGTYGSVGTFSYPSTPTGNSSHVTVLKVQDLTSLGSSILLEMRAKSDGSTSWGSNTYASVQGVVLFKR